MFGAHSRAAAAGMRVSVRLFACFCVASAISPHRQDGFYYTKSQSMFRRTNEDECRVCFGHDCVPVRQANCDYYMATSELQYTPEDEDDDMPNIELKAKVDKMLFDFVDKTQEYHTMECIPLISKFTDCHKENLCTGCQSCSCDDGKWACTREDCHAQRPIGSKELMMAVASLKGEDDQFERKKRSTNSTNASEADTTIPTFEELSRWMREQPLSEEYDREIVVPAVPNSKRTTSSPDYLAFDEVLSNIAVDHNNISRKKPALEPIDDEYVSFVDIVSADKNNTHDHKNRYTDNVIFDSKDAYDGNSFKVDLLEDLKSRLEEQFGLENYTGSSVVTGFVNDAKNSRGSRDFEANNYLDDANLSIVKRDVSQVIDKETNVTNNATGSADDKNDTIKDFKTNVLQPLISIIEDKESELNQLHAIKNSLVELITTMDNNFTLAQMANHTQNNRTLFSIYKLEIVPDKYESRRNGAFNIVDMYIKKLKRDVYELLRDLKGIKQNLVRKRLPKELESLFHALSRYVHHQDRDYLKEFRQYKGARRKIDENIYTSIKHAMFEVLELCDKELSGRESLKQLSETARYVLERVISQNQITDFAVLGLGINNPTYNLTKELKGIGSKWPELSKRVLHSSPPDQIYHMKLLHLMLIVDMNKIKDAIKVVEVDKHRRTILDTESSDQEVKRIENDITDLKNKIQNFLEKGISLDKNDTLDLNDNTITEKVATEKDSGTPVKKKSFLNQIKMLFRKSRQDIQNMLHKKVSKSDIVKELARNKLDEIAKQKMAQYEETLKKWQTKLGGARVKRSSFEYRKTKDRMKNILPLYLRGKVHPAIQKSKKGHGKKTGSSKAMKNMNDTNSGRKELGDTIGSRVNVSKPIVKTQRVAKKDDIFKRIDVNTNITKKHG